MTAADVSRNLAAVRGRIAAAADAAGRPADAVTLIAVSKAQPDDRVRAALAAGHRVFGENRIQEGVKRWRPLKETYPDASLHFVGPLQTNKADDAVAHFDYIHSLDRPKLARRVADAAAKQKRRPQCFVEVNTGEEAQKSGIMPDDADAFVALCREDYGLSIVGLMCIPPLEEEPALHFGLLSEIARRTGVAFLSMGMSADYELAVRLGATHVRVGTEIFGPRPRAE